MEIHGQRLCFSFCSSTATPAEKPSCRSCRRGGFHFEPRAPRSLHGERNRGPLSRGLRVKAPSLPSVLKRTKNGAAEWIRRRAVHVALLVLNRYGRAELLAACRKTATEIGAELSIRGVQQILQQEGIAVCRLCPRRSPLRKINGGYLCHDCFEKVQAKTREKAVVSH